MKPHIEIPVEDVLKRTMICIERERRHTEMYFFLLLSVLIFYLLQLALFLKQKLFNF